MKLYKDVLAHSWAITTQHSGLWIFGLFSALIVGNGGVIDKYFRYLQNILNPVNVLSPEFWQQGAWVTFLGNILAGLRTGDSSIWVYTILLVLAVSCVVYMMMVAQGALIHIASVPRKQPVKFVEAYLVGHRHAGPLFFLNLIVLLCLVGTVFAISAWAANSSWSNSWYEVDLLTVLLAGIVLIPVVFVSIFTAQYAANFIVLQNAHLWSAIVKGVKLFLQNWLVTFELSVIVFVLAVVLNLSLVLGVFIMMAPYVVSDLFIIGADSADALTSAYLLGALLYILGLLLLTSVFAMWQWSAWTNLFTRLLKEKHTGKIIRLLQA